MTRRLQDVIGAALGFPGGAGMGFRQGQVLFGQENAVVATPNGAAVVADPTGFGLGWGGYGYDPLCGAPYAQPIQGPSPSLIVGPYCGPQAILTYQGLDCCDEEVPAKGVRTFSFTPQITGRVVGLEIPQSIAANFAVLDLQVGNINVFAGKGCIPAETFSPLAECARITSAGFVQNQPVFITVKNLTKLCQPFLASIKIEGIDRVGPSFTGYLPGC